MSHSIEWLIDKRVLYSRVWGEQTLEQVQQSNIELKDHLEAGTPFIHLIMDVREMESMPRSLSVLQESLQSTRHPALGWVVSIGTSSPFTRYMGMMLAKLFRLRFRRVESLEEAVRFLHETDPSLNTDTTPQD